LLKEDPGQTAEGSPQNGADRHRLRDAQPCKGALGKAQQCDGAVGSIGHKNQARSATFPDLTLTALLGHARRPSHAQQGTRQPAFETVMFSERRQSTFTA